MKEKMKAQWIKEMFVLVLLGVAVKTPVEAFPVRRYASSYFSEPVDGNMEER